MTDSAAVNKQRESAENLRLSSAAAQACAITEGRTSSHALMAVEAEAIATLNPQLNAYILPVDSKLSAAGEAPSRLAGTSFAVKDNFAVAGLPTQAGLKAMALDPAKKDATVVARLDRAGLVFNGKLNMSPMAVGTSTHNADFGDCYSPLGKGMSAGGSSGGSASAVAAGLVGIALGTDTMGSVRLPAAFCGIVGFKPSWGQLPVEGLVPLCRMLDHVGVLSRSVEDAVIAYSIMLGDFSGESIATTTTSLGYVHDTASLALQPDVESAYQSACRHLQSSGYTLTPLDAAGLQLTEARRSGLILCEAELLDTLEGIYPEKCAQIPAELLTLLDFIQSQPCSKVGRANSRLAKARQRFLALFKDVDVVVLPTCAHTAFEMTDDIPADSADLTVIANVLQAPAISLPLPVARNGLPSGLQLIGRYGEDKKLLDLAAQLETLISAQNPLG